MNEEKEMTFWVDLIEWNPLIKKGVPIVRAYLSEGEVCFIGEEVLIQQLKQGIASSLSQHELIFPKDGMIFLESMMKIFRNVYLCASELCEGILSQELLSVDLKIKSAV